MQSTLVKSESTQTEVRLLHSFIISSAYFFGLALVLVALALVIHLEVTLISLSGNISENSVVEYLQEGYFIILDLLVKG